MAKLAPVHGLGLVAVPSVLMGLTTEMEMAIHPFLIRAKFICTRVGLCWFLVPQIVPPAPNYQRPRLKPQTLQLLTRRLVWILLNKNWQMRYKKWFLLATFGQVILALDMLMGQVFQLAGLICLTIFTTPAIRFGL